MNVAYRSNTYEIPAGVTGRHDYTKPTREKPVDACIRKGGGKRKASALWTAG
jgi:hypothetical protein